MTRQQKIILGALIFLFSAGLIAWWILTPRVEEMIPAPGSQDVLPGTPVTIRFSQPIDPKSISGAVKFTPEVPYSVSQNGAEITLDPLEPFTEGGTVQVTVGKGVKSTLGLSLTAAKTWTFEIKNAWLLYLLDSPAGTQLYRMDPEGLITDRLLDIPESVVDYSIAPGGDAILAVVQMDSKMEIRYYHLADGSYTTIYDCGVLVCSKPALSPDMKYMVYVTGETPEMGGKGGAQVWLLTLNNLLQPVGGAIAASGNEHPTRDPSWSALGWLVFYDDAMMEFAFIQPSTGERRQVYSDTGEPGDWNVVGDVYLVPEMQYTSNNVNNNGYYSRLIAYKPATGERIPFTQNNQAEDALPAYSPDGSKVAFARRFTNDQNWTPGRQLWTINANGSNSRQLTNDPDYHHLGFSWSPDNRTLAYLRFNTTNLNEDRELWFMDTSNGSRQKVLVKAYRLSWLP